MTAEAGGDALESSWWRGSRWVHTGMGGAAGKPRGSPEPRPLPLIARSCKCHCRPPTETARLSQALGPSCRVPHLWAILNPTAFSTTGSQPLVRPRRAGVWPPSWPMSWGLPAGLGADSRGPAPGKRPVQPIPVACTLHPYIWPSISSIWPFVCWLQLVGGWAGAPLGLGRRQSPPQETRPASCHHL